MHTCVFLSFSDCDHDSSSRAEGVSISDTVGQEIFTLIFRGVLNFMLSSQILCRCVTFDFLIFNK